MLPFSPMFTFNICILVTLFISAHPDHKLSDFEPVIFALQTSQGYYRNPIKQLCKSTFGKCKGLYTSYLSCSHWHVALLLMRFTDSFEEQSAYL